jgi:hypothetical protein
VGKHDAARTFGIYASTGRTGSTFLCRLFLRSPIAAVLHGGLPTRLDGDFESAEEMLATYFERLTGGADGGCVYVEGNPRFIERVAQKYCIADPCRVVRLLEAQGFSVRCLFMTRDPRGYALSMKNRGRELGRDPWPPAEKVGTALDAATFERIYACPAEWLQAQDDFGRICASWLLRNRFLKRLVDLPECHFVRFEDLFDRTVGDLDFVRRIQRIHDHFHLPVFTRIDELLLERRRPRNATTPVDKLTDDELEQLRAMCSADAAEWGYTV